ncbi:putative mitochondrial hypothetical protein [Leptomonas pyrrhocoris]|uniref:Uncharacterized protein n=1 Tax=Leptomonas pyrrhocoris TaxID=157538 RepID=A0A0M9G3P8_LEPPY|nr:putative mitochondrial hypothetical protein [Leptomonas pyrrhocoris]XP_015659934.1 putative mitochondrial hypothetical protein [Leptomonas pyrrhocoris]XP_015659935.1 putative mitochondrial hypothetical protein [Leptomonas pyrrhocoris]KPA81494.1 putative mitochondrial hypothetical protein [Leptomonas pyrrhocoris]KPA81495.1 putative mitochondrial hypothetical protein [Leptomonas pyrrhocoris]KPA81496.1 putative mitochondrial hypothetical protein [Leptomonas pyrrhocoris]|eukprot:XP_015659933.1 putative mitochondrial hypothetical protein [Leptomonas pyrrhocoris]
MYRQLLRPSASRAAVATACVCSTLLHNSYLDASCVLTGLPHQTPRRCLHSAAVFFSTSTCRFDLRQHEMEKRRARDLEKAGIDPRDADDEPWIAPEEQQRLDEEEEQRRAELEEQRKAFLEKRAEEDAVKRQRFKEFRAKQISMSRQRKAELAEKKEEARQHRRERGGRVLGDEAATAEDGAEVISNGDAGDGASTTSTK